MNGAVSQQSAGHGVHSIATQFVRARLAARALQTYPGNVPQDLAEAYRCQDEAIELWPDRVAGWKVARIGGQLAARYPEPRMNGPVFSRNVHIVNENSIATCPVFEGGFAAVETEIVIRARADAPENKIDWTLAEAADYIGDLHIGIEVASSPLATLNDLGPGAIISDFGNNWGVVVGRSISEWQNIQEIACETSIDGVSVGARTVNLEQGPLSAFAFTLGKCASRGRPLKAGAWITTGMITGVHDIRIGQSSRHCFANYGEVLCRVVRAEPFE